MSSFYKGRYCWSNGESVISHCTPVNLLLKGREKERKVTWDPRDGIFSRYGRSTTLQYGPRGCFAPTAHAIEQESTSAGWKTGRGNIADHLTVTIRRQRKRASPLHFTPRGSLKKSRKRGKRAPLERTRYFFTALVSDQLSKSSGPRWLRFLIYYEDLKDLLIYWFSASGCVF